MSEKTELLFDVGDDRLMTIGALVDRLRDEFPEVTVSKLRYLEEQRLISPRRTKGGYRLFSPEDYRRLVRVLTLQRDEYLPLKVIRRELERPTAAVPTPTRAGLRKADFLPSDEEREFSAEEIREMTGAEVDLLDELEDYELVSARQVGGVKRYSETDAAVIATAQQLAAAGLRPKNLRVLKSSTDREWGLIEQIILPALRSRRAERRREALDALEEIVQTTAQLQQLLLTKNIRRTVGAQSH
ncbi:MAG TPA: MerR family transcriptional regulator [Thermoleophilia bacterium]|nr:MerR family transcriptional regulator [Thermoleophilia bacterium]